VSEHAAVSSLLAAWTVHACERHEANEVEVHLRGCETCRAEVQVLATAAERLGQSDVKPAEALRDKILAGATMRPVPSYAQAYAATVAALDSLLREIDVHQWTGVVAHEQWTVLDVVTHLTATDNLVANKLGLSVKPPVDPDEDPESRTERLLAMRRDRTRSWERWRSQADAICQALVSQALPADLMVSRAFETWIHARDIALVTQKNLPAPPPAHLHTIADLAARLLPHAAECRRVARPGNVVRLVLSGDGGGIWTLPLAEPDLGTTVEMTIDVVEYCLLMGGRLEPRAVDVMIRGDVELGYDLLDAGPTLAPR
jgi:uncharacterized protein (TIGR03083 family)